jgi:hypothetical protein
MASAQSKDIIEVPTVTETENTKVTAGELTLSRLSYLPDLVRLRTERTVIFLSTDTGEDYRLDADQLYEGPKGEVLAVVGRDRSLVLPQGERINLSDGIWKIEHCG